MIAAWQAGQMFWSFLWFTLFFIWIWLLISVFADIFRSADLGGWGKTLWCIFVIVVPYLGVFVYLIARGHSMTDRTIQQAQAQQAAQAEYIRTVAGDPRGAAGEIAKVSELHDRGAITDAEFEVLKAKALS